ncbi:hypothetical protein EXE09_06400 [Acinetobacter sp. WCHAc060025]|nr:hypothetical protein EXE09_06400 [Acinetobacter sp. WCHAc060025]
MLPSWAKDLCFSKNIYNERTETVAEKYRKDWLNAGHSHTHEYFLEIPNEFATYIKENPVNLQGSLL